MDKKQYDQFTETVLKQCDRDGSPSMYAMGICSDIQEMLQRGMIQEANYALNELKVIIDQRLAKKDEQGRHI